MDLTEQLVCEMVLEVNDGSYKVSYHADGADQPPVEIDFKPPWKRISMISGLEEALSVKFPEDLASEKARVFLAKIVSFCLPNGQVHVSASYASLVTWLMTDWCSRSYENEPLQGAPAYQ